MLQFLHYILFVVEKFYNIKYIFNTEFFIAQINILVK